MQSWAYDGTTTFLRQPLETHWEAPFLVLLRGTERSLLIDTGTGHADVRGAVDSALSDFAPALLGGHSHSHSDHVGGDSQFEGRAQTSVVAHSVDQVRGALGLRHIDDVGVIELGGRAVEVVAIPGHEAAHVAFYDRATRILFTGDTLYPGRLTVRDWGAYRASIARLVEFTSARAVRHIIGAHIEMDAAEREYAPEAPAHPNEHGMLLRETHLHSLHARLTDLGDTPTRSKGRDWVVVPVAS